jgi:hypothetical protein
MREMRDRTAAGSVMRPLGAASVLVLVGLMAGACDDRQQRIEETAAPGMEQDAAAPASGPVDLDVDTILPEPVPHPMPADTMRPGPPSP